MRQFQKHIWKLVPKATPDTNPEPVSETMPETNLEHSPLKFEAFTAIRCLQADPTLAIDR